MLATTTLVAQHLTDKTWYLVTVKIFELSFTASGLCFAYGGLKLWKKQMKGLKAFEAGYNINYSLLKLREAIKFVRNPVIQASESMEAIRYARNAYPGKNDEYYEKNKYGYVYEMRWKIIKETQTEVKSHELGIEVLWGSEISELLKPLNYKINELVIALKKEFGSLKRKDADDYEKVERLIYGEMDESKKDEFRESVDQIILKIKTYITNKLN